MVGAASKRTVVLVIIVWESVIIGWLHGLTWGRYGTAAACWTCQHGHCSRYIAIFVQLVHFDCVIMMGSIILNLPVRRVAPAWHRRECIGIRRLLGRHVELGILRSFVSRRSVRSILCADRTSAIPSTSTPIAPSSRCFNTFVSFVSSGTTTTCTAAETTACTLGTAADAPGKAEENGNEYARSDDNSNYDRPSVRFFYY
jgi:hypothetical protein